MTKASSIRSLLAISLVATMTIMAPGVASAREGAQSVGNGIKCYTGLVLQPDGTYTVGRVCYKGV